MICEECGGDMVPQRGIVCPSGTDTLCAPHWFCKDCRNIVHIHDYDEFDTWLSEYYREDYVDPLDFL